MRGAARRARRPAGRRRRPPGRAAGRRAAVDVDRDVLRAMSTHRRDLLLTPELLRAYSRRGNFHSDADEASKLGLAGLVAQGMQGAGAAYGVLLDEGGDEFLDH